MKKLFSYTTVSLVVSACMLAVYHFSGIGTQTITIEKQADPMMVQTANPMPQYSYAHQSNAPTDFHLAADNAMPGVVHIKSTQTLNSVISDPFYELFGMAPRQRGTRQGVSTGSGVIISKDGYIVTNNHVIKDADELVVTLYDNRTYNAIVIGTDPTTDLGLIKIEGEGFPAIKLANSDKVRVGEWVLAVGNPFNLASTATAGIVSAIGRDLEIIKDQMAIESFIQTDAAVNPGNSGGALVNLNGELIGVNTAIASPTGAYAGYAFAVPANIVKKVIQDLREYGAVQRGFLGVTYIRALNGDLAKEKGLDITEGVIIEGIADKGGAAKAGLKKGDIIVSIDDIKVKNDAKLLELIARNRPGDLIKVEVYREGRYRSFDVQLTSEEGLTEIAAPERNQFLSELGVEYRDLSDEELKALQTSRGVLITKLHAGKIRQQTDIRTNFIITRVNDRPLKSSDDLTAILGKTGKITLTGFYPRSYRLYSYTLEL